MKSAITMESIQMEIDAGYGSVLKFDNYVFVTDIRLAGFTADVYKFVEGAKKHDIETPLKHVAKAKECFKDNGHAIAWCMAKAAKM